MRNIITLIEGKPIPEIPVNLEINYTNNLHGLSNQLFQIIHKVSENHCWFNVVLYGICDVVFDSNLNIKKFIHQVSDDTKSISNYSLFLRSYLNYQKEIKFYNPIYKND